ncbi:hypothetical protein KY285_000836 [Solanum tuberosum]|nr:hypothetical protein KY285_000836 [Solanum tuberosum]
MKIGIQIKSSPLELKNILILIHYGVDENIDDLSDLDEELLQARQSNIQEQVKEKVDRVNLDEIPSSPVDLGSDISEDEEDPVKNDEVVDPPPRNKSTKFYFDPTAKRSV